MATTKAEREEAIAELRKRLAPGSTVYCNLRHVSASGMSRVIDLLTVENGEIRRIGYLAHKALGWRYDDKREGIRVSGAGMDMGFHTVETLDRTLFPDGNGRTLRFHWL